MTCASSKCVPKVTFINGDSFLRIIAISALVLSFAKVQDNGSTKIKLSRRTDPLPNANIVIDKKSQY